MNPLKSAGFSYYEAKKFGFKFSEKLWKTNLRKKRNPGGRPQIDPYLKNSVHSYFEENSTIAANRFLKLQKTNARYRNKTLKNSFTSLNKEFQLN